MYKGNFCKFFCKKNDINIFVKLIYLYMNTQTFDTKYGFITCFSNDTVFYESMKNGNIYEEELILDNIIPLFINNSSNKVILDIGSHIGTHSIVYSKLISNAKIYVFEPQTEIFKLLKKNMEDNHFKNVEIFNNAVGHKIVDTTMSNMLYDGYNCNIEYNTNKILNYGGIGLGENGESCSMITIDSLDLERCDYIKIDVEGAEILVLMGGINTIQKYKPYIFFEKTDKCVSEEMKKSLNIDFEVMDTIDFLNDIGYQCKKIDECNYLAFYEILY